MLSIILLNNIMLRVVLLNVIMMNVVLLNVMAPLNGTCNYNWAPRHSS
jgi:hypothetical protein